MYIVIKRDDGLKVKDLKELLEKAPDDMQVYIVYEGVFGTAHEVDLDTRNKTVPGVFVYE